MPEAVVFINDNWHTGQLRDASFELASSSKRVLESLVPRVEEINPDLDWLECTVAVRQAITPKYVPSERRRKWDRDEVLVFQSIVSLPAHNTPRKIDKRATKGWQMFEYFRTPAEARDYLNLEIDRFELLQRTIEERRVDALDVTFTTYMRSRVLRLALYEGDYFVRTPRY